MTTLRELTKDLMEVQELANNPDIPPEALADTLNGLEGMFNEKAVRIGHVLLNGDSDITAIDDEIRRLTARKNVIRNGKDRLRDYLRMNMEAGGITKIECPLFTITLVKPRDVADVFDADELPPKYIRTKVTHAPDKKAILDDLKSGEIITGARLGKSKSSVRVK